MAKRILLKDLAQQLGLSVSTVSRALQHHYSISAATIERVAAHARQVGYQPNTLAAGLRHGRSRLLGLLVPHLANNYFAQVVNGVEQVAGAAGYRVLLSQSADDPQRERRGLTLLTDSRVEGLLVSVASGTHEAAPFAQVRAQGMPLVFYDRYLLGSPAEAVVSDDYAGAYEATRHLLAQGYRRIAHLSGPPHLSAYHYRCLGYQDALLAHGLPPDSALLLRVSSCIADGAAATRHLLSLPQPPDAIFAASDFAAVGCLQALRAAGRRVPDEVGVVGFSNELFTQLTEPPLTTVDQHGEEIGRAAARRLLQFLAGEPAAVPAQPLLLAPTLCVRASSQRTAGFATSGRGTASF